MTVAAAMTVVSANATAKIANIFFMVVYSLQRHRHFAGTRREAL
jgi:hypothetical protein